MSFPRGCVLLLLVACSSSDKALGVPATPAQGSPRTGEPTWVAPITAGPGSVAPGCPLWTPVPCGDYCCAIGDTCAGVGLCQETRASVYCPDGQIPCGAHCYPTSYTCDEDSVACPASVPVHCGTQVSADHCCAPGSACTTAGFCATFPTAPVGGVTCAAGGYCPERWTCLVDSQSEGWCSPPIPGNTAIYCNAPCVGANSDNCCAHHDYWGNLVGAQGTCSGDVCIYPTRQGTSPPCDVAAPQTCGEGLCCPESVVCGTCGCPAETPAPCGASACCETDEVCDVDLGCGACPADYPVACEPDDCCLPDATCAGGHCTCEPGEIECGDLCCSSGSVCGALDGALGCFRCPDNHPSLCEGRCCATDELCLQCPGESQPSCHAGSCPALACDVGQIAASCPDGTSRCCSENMVCCHDSMNGGAIGCEFSGFCE